MAMDRGTRRYAAILAAVVLVVVALAFYQPADVRRLNRMLAADDSLRDYPYPFRVLRLEQGTAVMGTPRSPAMPVERMIGAVAPGMEKRAVTDPGYLAAQQRLADTQAHARALVLADPAVERVRWELDQTWLVAHGVYPLPGD